MNRIFTLAGLAILTFAGGCAQCVQEDRSVSQPAAAANPAPQPSQSPADAAAAVPHPDARQGFSSAVDDPYYGSPGYPWDGPPRAYVYHGDIVHRAQ